MGNMLSMIPFTLPSIFPLHMKPQTDCFLTGERLTDLDFFLSHLFKYSLSEFVVIYFGLADSFIHVSSVFKWCHLINISTKIYGREADKICFKTTTIPRPI